MPNFAFYKNHTDHSIIYEKAKGEAFWDFLIGAAITEIDFSITREGFANPNTESVMNALKKAGYSLAKFHIWFGCPHGDMSPSNVFFYLYDSTVTFIDYSTFSYPENKDIIIDIDKFFNPYKAIGSDLSFGILDALAKKGLWGTILNENQESSLQRLQILKRVIAEGYNAALEEAFKDLRLVESEKGLFILETINEELK